MLTVSPHDSAQQQDRPKKDWTSTPQEIDGDGCSETPSDLDLSTLNLQEVPVIRKPKTDPCEVSVNWIGGTRHFGPDEGLEDDARIEAADTYLGICPVTAQVGATGFDKDDGGRKRARQVRALLDPAARSSPVPEGVVRVSGFDHGAVDTYELSTSYHPLVDGPVVREHGDGGGRYSRCLPTFLRDPSPHSQESRLRYSLPN